MADNKTQYIEFTGKAYWVKPYTPDEFRGASRWTMDLVMDDEAEWEKFHNLGIQKKVKTTVNGKQWAVTRNTSKLIKGKIVKFTPPVIMDKDGKNLIHYVDADTDLLLRSYEGEKNVKRIGDPIAIGNGSTVTVTVSVYSTAMGTGNRLESIKLVDLIEYKPETPAEIAAKVEQRLEEGEDVTAPW